jgi:hypothetical protein
MKAFSWATAASLVVLAGGCGSGGTGEGAARDTVRVYVHAFLAGDYDKACSMLSDKAASELDESIRSTQHVKTGGSCPGAMRDASDAIAQDLRAGMATVEQNEPLDIDVRTDGARARWEGFDVQLEEVGGQYQLADPMVDALVGI